MLRKAQRKTVQGQASSDLRASNNWMWLVAGASGYRIALDYCSLGYSYSRTDNSYLGECATASWLRGSLPACDTFACSAVKVSECATETLALTVTVNGNEVSTRFSGAALETDFQLSASPISSWYFCSFRFGHMLAYAPTSPGNCKKTPPHIEELVTSLHDHRESRVTVDGQGGWHLRHGAQAATSI